MKSKVRKKLGILLIVGLLLVAIGAPVLAATTNNKTGNGHLGLGNGTGICTGLTDQQQEKTEANRDARLKALVESGKLTQADYDARVALQEKMEQYRDKLADLSGAERQTKMNEYRVQALQELLKAGTITQAQYDQMSSAPGPGGRGSRGNCGGVMGSHRMGVIEPVLAVTAL
ncbi:MAG: hypothetical protein ACM3PE_10255 [Deltaproteobacteria bacterium]